MDRHSLHHRKSRVDLPLSVRNARVSTMIQTAMRRGRIRPAIKHVAGLLGFLTGGAAVVVTASLLALQL